MKLTVEEFREQFDKLWKSHESLKQTNMKTYYGVKLGCDKHGDEVVVILTDYCSDMVNGTVRGILRRFSHEHGPDVRYEYDILHPSQYETYCKMTGFQEEHPSLTILFEQNPDRCSNGGGRLSINGRYVREISVLKVRDWLEEEWGIKV